MLLTTASPAPAQNVGAIPAADAGQAVAGPEAAASATTTTAPEESGGLPQFKMEFWAAQIIWLVILFGALYLLLSRVFLPRIRGVRDEREGAISGAIDSARRARAEADAQSKAAEAELAAARAKAQAASTDAKARATAEAHARQKSQEAELSVKLAEAETRIQASRDKAMASVSEIAADTAAAMVARLTGDAPDEAQVQSALAVARA
jgi:F-type H+-transporting ATPase subunit b